MALNASIELKRSEEYQCMLLSAPVKLTENGVFAKFGWLAVFAT